MLGAGLDSFAWRRPDLIGDLILFEVDHPASQGWTRQRVIDLGLPVGSRHLFVPVDIERESIREGLDRLGFDWTQPTFFSWLGVTSYLTIEAIEDTLRMIASCASGSQVAFTYSLADELADDDWREFVGFLGPLAASSGEPLHPGWSPRDIEELVTRCGLRVTDHPNRGMQIERYFANRSDRLQPWGACLITAGVP